MVQEIRIYAVSNYAFTVHRKYAGEVLPKV